MLYPCQPLSDTRWKSRIDVLKPLRYNLAKIFDALMGILEDKRLLESSGKDFRAELTYLQLLLASSNFWYAWFPDTASFLKKTSQAKCSRIVMLV